MIESGNPQVRKLASETTSTQIKDYFIQDFIRVLEDNSVDKEIRSIYQENLFFA